MTETEKKKKKEKKNGAKKTARQLVNWAMLFVMLIIVGLISDIDYFTLQDLASFVVLIVISAIILFAFDEIIERWKARRYDTGTLASMETE